MELKPGDKLGPYEVVSAIGKGGMGEVWEAHDPRLNRDVAIKVSAQQFTDRFGREARAIAALNHPNICTLFDVGPNYLVMEYIDGAPPRGPLAPAEAVPLALGVAAGLEAAHDKGITHRDLKPANILVSRSGSHSGFQSRVKLLDFGLALVTGIERVPGRDADTIAGATVAGTVLGTAAYMSPEQAQGKTADARSDIFSFGLVLYELLSGRRAFAGDSAIEVIAAVLHKEPEPLETTPALQSIVTRCLRKAPAARFQTMNEVRAALEQVNAQGAAARIDPAGADETPSIAVLPFANLSPDKDNEYFSDGLAEEILNLLAKIPGLKVIARTSSFAFRGKEQDITKIAETLRVRTILEGSVRRAGNRIRVTAQLIEAENGSHLWSERYDRDMTDVFAVQDEIGQAISEALKVRLAPRAQPVNIEAWQNFLKARYHFVRLTPESLVKAKEYGDRALAIEPNYAPAYAGMAGYYAILALLGIKTTVEVAPLAKSAVEKALAIDPANTDAHSMLAMVAGIFDYDWKAAETHHLKAMATEPVQPFMRHNYATRYLLPLGRFQDAIEQCRLALESDPLSPLLYSGMVFSMFYARQYGEAIEYARRAMEIEANFYLLWFGMGVAQLRAGFTKEAITSLKRGVELAPWWPNGAWALAVAYDAAGDFEQSREWARRLEAPLWPAGAKLLAAAYHIAGDRQHSQEWFRKLGGSGTYAAAIYYAATGEVDSMFEALERAYRQRDFNLPSVAVEASFDPWRTDPRLQSLLRRVNL